MVLVCAETDLLEMVADVLLGDSMAICVCVCVLEGGG
jgi:hypothetical protein